MNINMMSIAKLILLFSFFVLLGCSINLKLTNFDDGETLVAECSRFSKECIMLLPNGETLSGTFSTNANGGYSFSTANVSSGVAYASGFGQGISSGGGQGYAILKSDKSKLVMEILLNYGWTGSGFGEARTNTGRLYKVQW